MGLAVVLAPLIRHLTIELSLGLCYTLISNVEFISDFLDDLAQFHQFFPKYKGYQLYGAVAGLDISPDTTRYAYRRGLFVLSVTGDDMVQLINEAEFTPHDFGTP